MKEKLKRWGTLFMRWGKRMFRWYPWMILGVSAYLGIVFGHVVAREMTYTPLQTLAYMKVLVQSKIGSLGISIPWWRWAINPQVMIFCIIFLFMFIGAAIPFFPIFWGTAYIPYVIIAAPVVESYLHAKKEVVA
jgi:hypothetical protein